MDEEELTYPIPANVTMRFEFLPGYGAKEAIATLIAFLIGVAIFLVLLGFIPIVIRTIIIIAGIFLTYILTKKSFSIVVSVFFVGAVIFALSLFKLPVYISVFAIIIPVALTIYYVKRDPITGFSMYGHSNITREYKKSQKVYIYRRELN